MSLLLKDFWRRGRDLLQLLRKARGNVPNRVKYRCRQRGLDRYHSTLGFAGQAQQNSRFAEIRVTGRWDPRPVGLAGRASPLKSVLSPCADCDLGNGVPSASGYDGDRGQLRLAAWRSGSLHSTGLCRCAKIASKPVYDVGTLWVQAAASAARSRDLFRITP